MNLRAFPFFDSLGEMQSACRHGELLLAPLTRFLPFQISKPHDGQPIDCINIHRAADGSLYRTIMGNQIVYDYHQSTLYDFITYYGDLLAEPLPCDSFYLEIQGRYSAIFSATPSLSRYLQVEWSNTGNLLDTAGTPLLIYQTGFMQRLYLKSVVTMPTYPYAETGNENEYKEFTADFKRITKQAQFDTLLLPPYLVDALGALPMHSRINVGAYPDVKEAEVTPDWQGLELSASVNVKFSEANPVIAKGCAEEFDLEEYDLSTYTPRGYVCGIADTNAAWTATGVVTCEQTNGSNTGYTLIEQQDMNPDSATYQQLRTVLGKQDLTACPVPVTYYSRVQSEYVQRNDCAAGYTGSQVRVRIEAGAFTSTISQLDADNKALAELDATKQAVANAQGTCTLDMQLAFAGELSRGWETPSQACASAATEKHYTASGELAIGQKVYTDSAGQFPAAPSRYYANEFSQVLTLDADSIIRAVKPCVL